MQTALFLLILAGGIGGVIVVLGASRRLPREWLAALRRVADELDLDYESGGWLGIPRAAGRIGDHGYALDSWVGSPGDEPKVCARIAVEARLPEGLELRKEGRISSFVRSLSRTDIQVGDPTFDDRFFVEGDRDVAVLARLGHRARRALLEASEAFDVQVRQGKLVWIADGLLNDKDVLLHVSRVLLELADALTEHAGRPAQALLHHAFHDEHLGFRRKALEALLEHQGRSHEAAEALERAGQDQDPGIRFLAARHRGEAGLAAIQALLTEGGLPASMREEALAVLGPRVGGGLSLDAAGAQDGELSLQRGDEGALSRAPVRKKRQTRS